MAIVGSYSSGSTLAQRYSTVDELLNQLPDNTANLIDASDVRDSVYSLWAYVEEVEQVASQSSTGTSYYTNSNPVPVGLGGILQGMSFSGTYSMQQMWDMLLYPYIAPVVSISGGTTREYGGPLTLSLPWSVTKKSNSITSIVLSASSGASISPGSYVPTGNSQAGTALGTGTHSTSPGISSTNTFTITVSDGTNSPSSAVTLTWMNKRYWGFIDLSSLGSIDITTNESQASLVSSFINMTSNPNSITSLTGASVGVGNELATSRGKTYTGINGTGYHLIFAFPTSFGTPIFSVNGNPNSAFTKVKSNTPLKNLFGFSGTNYDVWVSNTAQNSPLNIVIS
jgi:hypothetical protein